MEEKKTPRFVGNQDVFDFVTAHLLQQGQKSLRSDGDVLARGMPPEYCAYRSNEGLKCAAGCLILDEHYHLNLEGFTILGDGRGIVDHALMKSGVPEHTLPIVRELQGIHDVYPPYEWFEDLKVMATKHGLEWKFGEGP